MTDETPVPCQVEAISFHGWSAYRLSNGLITAIAVPELGGRIMSLKLGPYEYLFLNKALAGKRFTFEEHAGDGTIANWKNYGGDKTWPAPQGWDGADQWPGPPDPILDSGQYDAQPFRHGDAVGVTMISQADHRHTGLRIARRITLQPHSTNLRLDLTFENTSKQLVRWSIWNLAQLDCSRDEGNSLSGDCWLYLATDPGRRSGQPYQVLYGADNPLFLAQLHPAIADGVMGLHYQGHVGKIGVTSPPNWWAFANHLTGYVLCMHTPYQSSATYPDGGASLECWTESPGAPSPIPLHSPGFLLEAEVLGPLCTLQPGEQTTLPVDYSAAYCPGPIVASNEVGCAHVPLQVTTNAIWARVHGIFGCFVLGEAYLVWLDAAGNVIQRRYAAPTSPWQVLNLDLITPLPDGARQIYLQVQRPDGTTVGNLAEVSVKAI